jgi:general secretion pathway protein A
MYHRFFRLGEAPFSLQADPRFLYLSPTHARARACLDYAVDRRDGLVVVTGDAGCGKSMLVADLSSRVNEGDLVVLDQTQLDPRELLQTLLLRLGHGNVDADSPQLRERLQAELADRVRAGRRMTLIIDEAQHLPRKTLEELRVLADQLEDGSRLVGVILVGQPALARTLKSAGLEQLRQRVRLIYSLAPLTRSETRRYIHHRLGVAGAEHVVAIPPDAMRTIQRYTGGVPRLINVLVDMALTAAALERTEVVSADIVRRAVEELRWEPFAMRDSALFLRRLRANLTDTIGSSAQAARTAAANGGTRLRQRAPLLLAALRMHAQRLQAWFTAWFRQLDTRTMAVAGGGVAAAALVTVAAMTSRDGSAPAASPTLASAAPAQLAASVRSPPMARQVGAESVTNPLVAMQAETDNGPAPYYALEIRVPTEERVLGVALPPQRRDTASTVAVAPATAAADRDDELPAGAESTLVSANHAATGERTGPENATVARAPTLIPEDPDLHSARWLLTQPAEAYTLQLFAASDPDRIGRYLQMHEAELDGSRELAAFTADRDGQAWHVLVLGPYPSYGAARQASRTLPEDIRAAGPWIRRLDSIHAAILERDAGEPMPPRTAEDYVAATATPLD